MSAFLLADVRPDDIEAYRASGYLEGAASTARAHGGVYVARGGETTVLEGDWEPERMVIIRFPTMEDLLTWYHGPEYQEWAPVRRRFVRNSKLVALRGIS